MPLALALTKLARFAVTADHREQIGKTAVSMNARAFWAPPRPRLFFMHLPKTAGMALRLFLGNQYPVDQIMPANDGRELLSVDLAALVVKGNS